MYRMENLPQVSRISGRMSQILQKAWKTEKRKNPAGQKGTVVIQW